MKLVLAWITVLAVTAITAASCSINHATDSFECTKQADCAAFPGRTCTGGYCVLPGGVVDAPKGTDGPVVDGSSDGGNVCPAQCTSCETGTHTCKIDCAVTSCNGPVVCPVGWNCDVGCTTANSCRNGVTCSPDQHNCKITCSGSGSCRALKCGGGKCDVGCSGNQACRDVACGQSCGCDVACAPQATCESVACTAFQCDTGLGCSSQVVPTCETCP